MSCYIDVQMNARMRTLERRIEKVKKDLAELGDLRVGSVSKQYNVCGQPGCRCKASPPRKHGPYYQLSFARKGKSSSRFVRRENLKDVQGQVSNYRRLRKLIDTWIDLATELSDLRLRAKQNGR
ncbi:MAG: DUF6788 family protein [Candidatus Binatia bacterium]